MDPNGTGSEDRPGPNRGNGSDLWRVNRALRTLSAGNRTLLRAAQEQDLLHGMCRVIVNEGGYSLAFVAYAQHDAQKSLSMMAYVARPMPADRFKDWQMRYEAGHGAHRAH